jgi:DUF4097 and DUF4098 domain-containing protein YvlB
MRRAVALTALLVCSGCVDIVGANVEGRYVEREEKRFQISGKAEVALSTFDGSIEVRPWTRSEVEVVIEKRGADKSAVDKIQVAANQAGDRVTVEVKHPHRDTGFHFGPSARAKLIVSLPESSDLVAKSGDGSIDVERLAGRIELRSGDGSIRARELAGDVTAETGDGSIMLDGRFSALRAHSGDGSVRIHAAAGTSASRDWDISTGDGSVTLEIPEGFSGELDAHTGDGGVNIDNVTVSNVSGELHRNSVRGRLGTGGYEVRVRTGDGSITIKRP